MSKSVSFYPRVSIPVRSRSDARCWPPRDPRNHARFRRVPWHGGGRSAVGCASVSEVTVHGISFGGSVSGSSSRICPQSSTAMDQPSIDGINTWFVAKAAKEAGLKVALSGLGGDELLGGLSELCGFAALASPFRLFAAVPGLGRLARAIIGQ